LELRYQSRQFRIFSDTPYSIEWFYCFIEEAYKRISDWFGFEPSRYLPIKCTIKQGKPGGISGWTGGGEFGVEAAPFTKNRWCLCLSVQELVNIFTGSLSSGWPVDWWANHKSPFPIMAAIRTVRNLGYVKEAEEHNKEFLQDPLYKWFDSLTPLWKVFSDMFERMWSDGISWDRIGVNPSKLRTNYVLAYMMRVRDALDVIPEADRQMGLDIETARGNLQRIPRSDSRWIEYLHGNYKPALVTGKLKVTIDGKTYRGDHVEVVIA